MKKYFNIYLEFDKDKVDQIIHDTIIKKGKGFVCSVEANNLTVANKNPDFLRVVNGALVNICDGSMLAKILGFIHKRNFESYLGADLFLSYVKKCQYKQYFIGNTRQVLDGLRDNLTKIDSNIASMKFEELPFLNVEDFNYEEIAKNINKEGVDVIWVSLGAPKQELFMSNLLPYLNQGVMFGFGAIFNFNSGVGHVKRAPKWMIKLNLEWLYRAFEEPKKNVPRYLNFIKILPRLIKKEILIVQQAF